MRMLPPKGEPEVGISSHKHTRTYDPLQMKNIHSRMHSGCKHEHAHESICTPCVQKCVLIFQYGLSMHKCTMVSPCTNARRHTQSHIHKITQKCRNAKHTSKTLSCLMTSRVERKDEQERESWMQKHTSKTLSLFRTHKALTRTTRKQTGGDPVDLSRGSAEKRRRLHRDMDAQARPQPVGQQLVDRGIFGV